MSLPFGSMRVFISNYVFHSFGFILRYFFRFLHLGDTKKEINIQQSQQLNDGNFHDSKMDGFSEELANFLFWSEEFHERETEYSVFMDTIHEGKTECSVLKENHSDFHEESVKTELLSKKTVSKEIESHIQLHLDDFDREKEDGLVFVESECANFVVHEDSNENEGEEGEDFVIMETDPNVHQTETKKFVLMDNSYDLCNDNKKIEEEIGDISIDKNETECSVFMENVSVAANEDDKKLVENEINGSFYKVEGCNIHDVGNKIDKIQKENFVFGEDGFNGHDDSKREEETEQETEQETGDSVFMQSDTITTTTSKCEFFSGKDISCFMEEPTKFRFSFREFYASPNVSYNEFSSLDLKKDIVHEEEKEESIHETDNSPIRFESEAFGGTDSSEEDYFLFNENSVTSDSESESSSSSGLILSNINKIDDSFSYHFLGGKNGSEGFESEILNLITREEKQSSFDDKVSNFEVHEAYSENEYIEMEPKMKKNEETKWEDELNESESEEDDFEWEHDDLVEQLKLELKNSRQGGLATIIEEVEEDFEENEEVKEQEQEQEQEKEFTKVVEEFENQLKIEEKVEYMDQMDEIEIVYKSYAEKMRKLDILNYQTMHALGLLQLKDPLKLISIPKSTILNAKNGIISHTNLWPRKPTKITSDPFHKIVDELHRDLELVYVGQICLSWEILCWQHMKAIELQEYDSQGSHHRYNHVAGEFQLFQVLMQRFIENEPFQSGPRIQNYVKNRCVIRNLLHVPAIKDDIKGSEEDAITSGKLQDIIKESMRMFWEFVRADKDNGNVISKHIGFNLKDPAISGLLVDIKTQLQKKDRKLKDIVRTGNCIVKKFQKHHEDQLDHEQLVAQVGLKLISRVVNMSQLKKDQVLWCSEKLQRIKFLSRKIVHVEPSFLLFPC